MGLPLKRSSFDRPPRCFSLLTCLAACAGILLGGPADAQDVASFYSGKTVRIVVGFSAGGGYDQYARLLARHIGRHIPGNPTVVVQNMPGSASLKSVQYLDRRCAGRRHADHHIQSRPDHAIDHLARQGPVKFLNYAWIGNVSEDFRVCYTWNGSGIKNWQEFLEEGQGDASAIPESAPRPISTTACSANCSARRSHLVMGYPGSADKRLAIERGELDGDCGSWTSMPEDWLQGQQDHLAGPIFPHARCPTCRRTWPMPAIC